MSCSPGHVPGASRWSCATSTFPSTSIERPTEDELALYDLPQTAGNPAASLAGSWHDHGVTPWVIEHVQMAMPAGGEEAARRFYSGLLGLPEQPKPPNLAERGGCWFGVRIVDDEPLDGYHRVYADDPFGNRIELMEEDRP